MRSNAGMTNRQGDVDLRFAQVSAPQLTLWLGLAWHSSYLPAYENGTECSETSSNKIQTPGNYPEEIIQPFLYFKLPFQKFRLLWRIS